MSKRKFGKYIAFAAILGVITAGISYFVKYKSFHKELEEDFHDFEDEFDDGFKEEPSEDSESVKRTYVSINRDSESTPEDKTEANTVPVPEHNNIYISEDEDMYN